MSATDAELVEAACQGDLASFGQLYERHYRMAVGIARSRLDDGHLAEDAAQEAFAVACRTIATLQQGSRFPQWLGTICRRTASRIAKHQPAHTPLNEEPVCAEDDVVPIHRESVHEALRTLDETAREIVILHYFSGLSYEQIAAVTNLSPQAIHGRLQRARCKLSTLLQPEGKTE